MGQEFVKLESYVKRVEPARKSIENHSKELNDASCALSAELQQVSVLTDRELSWLKTRDLSGLHSAAASASQEVVRKADEHKLASTATMQGAGQKCKEAAQLQQIAQTDLKKMQALVCDTSTKPVVIQGNVSSLSLQEHAAHLQGIVDCLPKAAISEFEKRSKSFVGALEAMVSPIVDMLKKAPVMPEGVALNEVTGEIVALLQNPISNCVFTVRASNKTGECASTVVLSARGQIAPSGLTYISSIPAASEFAEPPQSTGLVLVGDAVSIKPTFKNPGLPFGTFSVTVSFTPTIPPLKFANVGID